MYSTQYSPELAYPEVWRLYSSKISKAYYENDFVVAHKSMTSALKKSQALGELDPAILSILENLVRHYYSRGKHSKLRQLHSSLKHVTTALSERHQMLLKNNLNRLICMLEGLIKELTGMPN